MSKLLISQHTGVMMPGGFLYIYLDILLYILHTQKSIFKGAFPFCSVYINKSGEDEHLCVSDIVQSGYKKKILKMGDEAHFCIMGQKFHNSIRK